MVVGGPAKSRDSTALAKRIHAQAQSLVCPSLFLYVCGWQVQKRLVSCAERIGRNPRTGEEHRIAPHHTVVLIPSARLREALEPRPSRAKAQK